MDNQSSQINQAVKAERVIPLLEALGRVESNISSLAMRLDPITSHVPQTSDQPSPSSVTGRLHTLGDVLQYLLDNIEL